MMLFRQVLGVGNQDSMPLILQLNGTALLIALVASPLTSVHCLMRHDPNAGNAPLHATVSGPAGYQLFSIIPSTRLF